MEMTWRWLSKTEHNNRSANVYCDVGAKQKVVPFF